MAKTAKTQAVETPPAPRPAETTATPKAPEAPEADGAGAPPATSELEGLAVRLDAMAEEATGLGEDTVAKSIRNAAKSARWFNQQRAARQKRFGSLVAYYQTEGLTPEQITTRLTK
jgi:hypothetical protein